MMVNLVIFNNIQENFLGFPELPIIEKKFSYTQFKNWFLNNLYLSSSNIGYTLDHKYDDIIENNSNYEFLKTVLLSEELKRLIKIRELNNEIIAYIISPDCDLSKDYYLLSSMTYGIDFSKIHLINIQEKIHEKLASLDKFEVPYPIINIKDYNLFNFYKNREDDIISIYFNKSKKVVKIAKIYLNLTIKKVNLNDIETSIREELFDTDNKLYSYFWTGVRFSKSGNLIIDKVYKIENEKDGCLICSLKDLDLKSEIVYEFKNNYDEKVQQKPLTVIKSQGLSKNKLFCLSMKVLEVNRRTFNNLHSMNKFIKEENPIYYKFSIKVKEKSTKNLFNYNYPIHLEYIKNDNQVVFEEHLLWLDNNNIKYVFSKRNLNKEYICYQLKNTIFYEVSSESGVQLLKNQNQHIKTSKIEKLINNIKKEIPSIYYFYNKAQIIKIFNQYGLKESDILLNKDYALITNNYNSNIFEEKSYNKSRLKSLLGKDKKEVYYNTLPPGSGKTYDKYQNTILKELMESPKNSDMFGLYLPEAKSIKYANFWDNISQSSKYRRHLFFLHSKLGCCEDFLSLVNYYKTVYPDVNQLLGLIKNENDSEVLKSYGYQLWSIIKTELLISISFPKPNESFDEYKKRLTSDRKEKNRYIESEDFIQFIYEECLQNSVSAKLLKYVHQYKQFGKNIALEDEDKLTEAMIKVCNDNHVIIAPIQRLNTILATMINNKDNNFLIYFDDVSDYLLDNGIKINTSALISRIFSYNKNEISKYETLSDIFDKSLDLIKIINEENNQYKLDELGNTLEYYLNDIIQLSNGYGISSILLENTYKGMISELIGVKDWSFNSIKYLGFYYVNKNNFEKTSNILLASFRELTRYVIKNILMQVFRGNFGKINFSFEELKKVNLKNLIDFSMSIICHLNILEILESFPNVNVVVLNGTELFNPINNKFGDLSNRIKIYTEKEYNKIKYNNYRISVYNGDLHLKKKDSNCFISLLNEDILSNNIKYESTVFFGKKEYLTKLSLNKKNIKYSNFLKSLSSNKYSNYQKSVILPMSENLYRAKLISCYTKNSGNYKSPEEIGLMLSLKTTIQSILRINRGLSTYKSLNDKKSDIIIFAPETYNIRQKLRDMFLRLNLKYEEFYVIKSVASEHDFGDIIKNIFKNKKIRGISSIVIGIELMNYFCTNSGKMSISDLIDSIKNNKYYKVYGRAVSSDKIIQAINNLRKRSKGGSLIQSTLRKLFIFENDTIELISLDGLSMLKSVLYNYLEEKMGN